MNIIIVASKSEDKKMKIKNHGGRAWISKYDDSGITIHITNAEVVEAELKGTQLIIKVKE